MKLSLRQERLFLLMFLEPKLARTCLVPAGRPKELRLSYAAARGRGVGRSAPRAGSGGGRGRGGGKKSKAAAIGESSGGTAYKSHTAYTSQIHAPGIACWPPRLPVPRCGLLPPLQRRPAPRTVLWSKRLNACCACWLL